MAYTVYGIKTPLIKPKDNFKRIVLEKVEALCGIETKDMSLICAVKHITGPKGTKVVLTIRRPGEEQCRDITIIRDRVIVAPIRGWQRTLTSKWLYMIDPRDKIGYIRISNFNSRTADDFENALCRLEEKGLKGYLEGLEQDLEDIDQKYEELVIQIGKLRAGR